MRNLISIILILSTIACSSKKVENKQHHKSYIIIKIDSVDNYYIIYGKSGNENYKLVSEKTNSKCDNIIVGEKYILNTESIFTMKIKVNDSVKEITNHVNIKCMTLHGTTFCKEYENGIYDVLKSENLEGLCYKEK